VESSFFLCEKEVEFASTPLPSFGVAFWFEGERDITFHKPGFSPLSHSPRTTLERARQGRRDPSFFLCLSFTSLSEGGTWRALLLLGCPSSPPSILTFFCTGSRRPPSLSPSPARPDFQKRSCTCICPLPLFSYDPKRVKQHTSLRDRDQWSCGRIPSPSSP